MAEGIRRRKGRPHIGLCEALEIAAEELKKAKLTPEEREAFRRAAQTEICGLSDETMRRINVGSLERARRAFRE